jgi:hypothetical protein
MCEATNNTSANNTSANNTSVNNTSVNNTSANNTSVSSGWDVVIDDYKSIANKTDYLWVIDNSFSMCQEQDALRKNLDAFVAGLVEGEVDFHIGLTTTHAPESGFSIEPLAKEAHLQSTPQPVPGNNQECLTASDGSYAPIRKALEDAKRCLTNPEEGVKYEWNDEQIACALQSPNAQQSSGCLSKTRLEDRNGDSTIDLFDLFPDSSSYRPIPKVLRAQDYRDAQGNIEKDRLIEDLFCISVVGTRGDGYEKGLRAAVKAVSPDFTGGIPGAADADPSKPNHGLFSTGGGVLAVLHDRRTRLLARWVDRRVAKHMRGQYLRVFQLDAGVAREQPAAHARRSRQRAARKPRGHQGTGRRPGRDDPGELDPRDLESLRSTHS